MSKAGGLLAILFIAFLADSTFGVPSKKLQKTHLGRAVKHPMKLRNENDDSPIANREMVLEELRDLIENRNEKDDSPIANLDLEAADEMKPKQRKESKITGQNVNDYLEQFGYLNAASHTTRRHERKSETVNALKRFQKFSHLKQTGVADEATLDMMAQPRCGNPDVTDSEAGKRFVTFGSWNKLSLTYYIKNYSPDMPQSDFDELIEMAFKMWSEVSSLTFTKSTTSAADLTILFGSRSHGDTSPFDGAYGVLAHASGPGHGDICFDEDETWTRGTHSGMNFLMTAVHEFGHALGLDHSDAAGATMGAYHTGYDADYTLSADDIAAIQSLYGTAANPILPPVCNGFMCDSGRCIGGDLKCNRMNNCGDFSDEMDCPVESGPSPCTAAVDYFQCATHFGCVPLAWNCDGDDDCRDGSDEPNC